MDLRIYICVCTTHLHLHVFFSFLEGQWKWFIVEEGTRYRKLFELMLWASEATRFRA